MARTDGDLANPRTGRFMGEAAVTQVRAIAADEFGITRAVPDRRVDSQPRRGMKFL